jgi:nitroreductase
MQGRRDFMKTAMYSSLVLGFSSILTACSGLKRRDVPVCAKEKDLSSGLDAKTRNILYYASLAPSGHNCQPWRVRIEDRQTWVVEADLNRQLAVVDPQNRELLLSLGAFVQNLCLAAGRMGLAAEPQVIAKSRHDRDVLRIKLHKARVSNYPLQRMKKRRTVKNGYLAKEIAAADIKVLTEHLPENIFYFPRGSKHASCIAEAAVENYRLQTYRDEAQKELVKWLRLSDRQAAKHRDGLSTEGMEIQGLKGWFVRHFVKSKDFLKKSYRKQGIDLMSNLANQGGGWLIVTSQGQTVSDLINTGRSFESMALLARECGIGIHPMTQMLEEKEGLRHIAEEHNDGFHPQFVLRVGYLEKYPEPVSLRRPVEWFAYQPLNS